MTLEVSPAPSLLVNIPRLELARVGLSVTAEAPIEASFAHPRDTAIIGTQQLAAQVMLFIKESYSFAEIDKSFDSARTQVMNQLMDLFISQVQLWQEGLNEIIRTSENPERRAAAKEALDDLVEREITSEHLRSAKVFAESKTHNKLVDDRGRESHCTDIPVKMLMGFQFAVTSYIAHLESAPNSLFGDAERPDLRHLTAVGTKLVLHECFNTSMFEIYAALGESIVKHIEANNFENARQAATLRGNLSLICPTLGEVQSDESLQALAEIAKAGGKGGFNEAIIDAAGVAARRTAIEEWNRDRAALDGDAPQLHASVIKRLPISDQTKGILRVLPEEAALQYISSRSNRIVIHRIPLDDGIPEMEEHQTHKMYWSGDPKKLSVDGKRAVFGDNFWRRMYSLMERAFSFGQIAMAHR